jgi:hypothetical protein
MAASHPLHEHQRPDTTRSRNFLESGSGSAPTIEKGPARQALLNLRGAPDQVSAGTAASQKSSLRPGLARRIARSGAQAVFVGGLLDTNAGRVIRDLTQSSPTTNSTTPHARAMSARL